MNFVRKHINGEAICFVKQPAYISPAVMRICSLKWC